MKITNLKYKIQDSINQEIQKFLPNLSLDLEIQYTKEGFEGDFTLVVFPLVGILKKKPEEVAKEIGELLIKNLEEIDSYNVVKGFLNLSIINTIFSSSLDLESFIPSSGLEKVLVEYSSPNTNKPLHLGHVRNNLLGFSVSKILAATGKKVKKLQLVNDRGIHICKSMVAYQKFGNQSTPESTNTKGDHFVGKYYVKFDLEYKKQIKELINSGLDENQAKQQSPIFLEAQEMLRKWEAGDQEVLGLWEKMNHWVYKGFGETYKRLGVDFDETQYESNTYLLGKMQVENGLQNGIFYKKEDGSVWINLEKEGLEEKLLLRADGTSVYITQDIGTAIERIENEKPSQIVYTVGNEQDYHFKVLFSILEKITKENKTSLVHLSYGMVELPEGKMKSREGNVVDADDLMENMHQTAQNIALEKGKLEEMSEDQKNRLYEVVGLGALKYHLLKVNPKKTILFDPEKSVDFQGNTGPFIQYTYARIQSLLHKEETNFSEVKGYSSFSPLEKKILLTLDEYPLVLQKSAEEFDPSHICNYLYDLVKKYNLFYQNTPILKSKSKEKAFRLLLSESVAQRIRACLDLLGIETVDKM